MILGAMQPYFFPYLGYYDLINRTDYWIVFDVVQYKRKSWMNRNRMLSPNGGWQYISVPVKQETGSPVSAVTLVDKESARRRINGQIMHYRKAGAPHFSAVKDIINDSFASHGGDDLVGLNLATLTTVCNYLGITLQHEVLSSGKLRLPKIQHPAQWALELATALSAEEYVNPPGGRDIFRPEEFRQRGIRLSFTELLDFRYDCGPYSFVERLSILDVLMWNRPEAVKAYLDNQRQNR